MHLFVWGSILIWFVVIPSTSSPFFYSDFFQYVGVAYEVMSTPNFWFYFPLATVVALAPTMLFRLYNLYRHPTFIDYVRLKEKKEGKKTFLRKKMRSSTSRKSMRITGYAFSHQEGFGDLITTGHIFGLNEGNVTLERSMRQSRIMSSPVISRAATETPMDVLTEDETLEVNILRESAAMNVKEGKGVAAGGAPPKEERDQVDSIFTPSVVIPEPGIADVGERKETAADQDEAGDIDVSVVIT